MSHLSLEVQVEAAANTRPLSCPGLLVEGIEHSQKYLLSLNSTVKLERVYLSTVTEVTMYFDYQ